eukprot:TRINITY_DN13069_c0_g1_i1.p1 TRINITY_DN13069_c0_g1~~TRINITY_DN13069_c0_g1_i1.p1  ORF type:complete len:400 (-),score=69.69 TRINITY_DN13069_c0_g1_i1:183-1382(-)
MERREPNVKTKHPTTLDGTAPEDIAKVYALHQYIEDPADISYEQDDPPLILPEQGFRVELGGSVDSLSLAEINLECPDMHEPYYKTYFYSKPHLNFISGNTSNPIVISAIMENKKTKGRPNWRVILREKKENHHYMISSGSKQGFLKKLRVTATDLLEDFPLHDIKDTKLNDELVNMEDRMLIKAYKIGFVYCDSGQVSELDMFSNNKVSKACDKFLHMMGDEITLKGYSGYRGGLDVNSNTTGTHAFASNFHGFDIIFHVSHYLPFSTENPQQLDRKRHIGNDVVVIVFTENPGGFLPSTITSKFNHIYVLVHPLPKRKGEKQIYQIGIASKNGTRVHGPPLPRKPLFERGPELREFLYTKIINAERAAYFAPGFAQTRTRRLWLKELQEKYCPPEKK